jgi:hypothetical protein
MRGGIRLIPVSVVRASLDLGSGNNGCAIRHDGQNAGPINAPEMLGYHSAGRYRSRGPRQAGRTVREMLPDGFEVCDGVRKQQPIFFSQ